MAPTTETNGIHPGNCVYSTTGSGNSGMPHAPRQKFYWLVETLESGEMIIRHLDEKQWLPTGDFRPVTLRELRQGDFKPEPELYHKTVFPRLQARHTLQPPQNVSVPQPLDAPQDQVEETLRSMFDEAMDFATSGNSAKAEEALGRILNLGNLAQKKHRHMFNDFGITLRKRNMGDKAVAFYNRALELTGEEMDANLHFNLARVLFDQGHHLTCTQQLFKALKADPGNWAAVKFLAWMEKKGLIPKQYHLDVTALLAGGIPARPEEALTTAEKGSVPASPSLPAAATSLGVPSPCAASASAPVSASALGASLVPPAEPAVTPRTQPAMPSAMPQLPTSLSALQASAALSTPSRALSEIDPLDDSSRAKADRIKAALSLLEASLPDDYDVMEDEAMPTLPVAPSLLDRADRPARSDKADRQPPLLPSSLDELLAPVISQRSMQARL